MANRAARRYIEAGVVLPSVLLCGECSMLGRGLIIHLWGFLLLLTPTVCGADEPEPVGFVRDVVPALTKLGCNAGACHGSFQGRGGFRLSLLGFDPAFDYAALTKEGRGRRVSATVPSQSLLLAKPTNRIPHGGGKRLDEGSPAFRILSEWLALGAEGPSVGDSQIAGMQVSPRDIVLKPGEESRLDVRVDWSDGATRRVNAWALFDCPDETILHVDELGRLQALGPGRAAVTVRYMGHVGAVTVTVPYGDMDDKIDSEFEQFNFIDGHISREWRKLGLEPAGLAGDAEFLRRVSLDLIGRLPTPAEAREFLASNDRQKRTKTIDALLERPAYVDAWALKWSDLLRGHRRFLGEKGLWSFYGWIRQQIRDNRPADRLVRDLLTARGNLYSNGAVAFYYVDQTPLDLAETTAQIFLGVRLQCARCHHHPFEVWSQQDYYGLAAFFTRVERKDSGENGLLGGTQSIQLAASGSIKHPETGQTVSPRLLGASIGSGDGKSDLRVALADWVTADANPYFAKNLVNRYWHHFFGRGLVSPVDDLRGTNPPSHPALFDALAADLVAHDYDLQHLIRTICSSRTYQLASEIAPGRDRDGMFYTHRVPRRLPAEVLLDAIHDAAGTEQRFDGLPPDFRAVTLPDGDVKSYFLDTFGRPQRTTTCSCERRGNTDLKQVLHLVNGDTLHQNVTSKDGRVRRLLDSNKVDVEIVEELYLATLTRLPTDEEAKVARTLAASAPSRQEGFEDLLWTLLNCAEFSFQH